MDAVLFVLMFFAITDLEILNKQLRAKSSDNSFEWRFDDLKMFFFCEQQVTSVFFFFMLWLILGKQKVRFPEFLKMLAEQTGKMISTEKEILAAFTALDREKTGSVSRSQLQHLMTGTGDKLGTEECK